jgi:hypothetical protein
MLCRSCAKLGQGALNLVKNRLLNYYVKKQMSLRKIGKILKCDGTTILSYLKKYKIKRRTKTETNKIRKISNKTKKKISIKAKIRFRIPKNNPMFGKKHTLQSVLKMIKNHPHISGKNHYNYNPNITNKERINKRFPLKYQRWTQSILKFYNYTCQICGDNKGHNLVAHHLNGWHWCKELRIDKFNGICLCENCHKNFHSTYGYKYNTIEQFLMFYKKKGAILWKTEKYHKKNLKNKEKQQ